MVNFDWCVLSPEHGDGDPNLNRLINMTFSWPRAITCELDARASHVYTNDMVWLEVDVLCLEFGVALCFFYAFAVTHSNTIIFLFRLIQFIVQLVHWNFVFLLQR